MDDPKAPDPAGDDLQFDRAEPAEKSAASLTCAACRRSIESAYFTANDAIFCSSCREQLDREMTSGGGKRFGRALGLGLLAAALGSGIYYAVVAITGWEIALVAIVVGFLVGAAVKKGSGDRGGWPYQILAVFLTYGAIVTTYIPYVYEAIIELPGEEETPPGEGESAEREEGAEAPPLPAPSGEDAESASCLLAVVAIAVLFLIACAAPFLAGAENILGLLIIGFALYQAWVMNKRVPISIAGPFDVGDAGARAASPENPPDA